MDACTLLSLSHLFSVACSLQAHRFAIFFFEMGHKRGNEQKKKKKGRLAIDPLFSFFCSSDLHNQPKHAISRPISLPCRVKQDTAEVI